MNGYSTEELRRLLPSWSEGHPDNHEPAPDDDALTFSELCSQYDALLCAECPACAAVRGLCVECDKRLAALAEQMEETL